MAPNGSRKKILDHSDQFLGFQNAANLSRWVPTPISQLFKLPKITKKSIFGGGSAPWGFRPMGARPMGAPWGPKGAQGGPLYSWPYFPLWVNRALFTLFGVLRCSHFDSRIHPKGVHRNLHHIGGLGSQMRQSRPIFRPGLANQHQIST